MAQDKPTDPSAMFQEWVTQWERTVDKFSNQFMGTEDFSRSLNQMQNLQLEFQRAFGEQMARQLAAFNMPSRDDVLQLSEDVRELDRRIARMEATLNKLLPAGANEAGVRRRSPPRTRKPAPKREES
ncbi:MAG: poly(R)-hydroxyalkanoic acid synthase subunit PhaE [Pseudomonadota bacterium]